MRTGSQIPLTQDQVRLAFILQGPHSPITAAAFRANKPSDIISTLVSIYDSKDLFVKELQVLLAQRLLAITDGNFEKEVRNVVFILVFSLLNARNLQRRNIEILKVR